MERVKYSEDLLYSLDGMSLEEAIAHLADRKEFVEANNGTAIIDREYGGGSGDWYESDHLNLLIERDITQDELDAREKRARAEAKALEDRKAAQAKAEYNLYTNLKIKYEGGA